jgi:hypothetical protein
MALSAPGLPSGMALYQKVPKRSNHSRTLPDDSNLGAAIKSASASVGERLGSPIGKFTECKKQRFTLFGPGDLLSLRNG